METWRFAVRASLPVFGPAGVTEIVPADVFSTRENPLPTTLLDQPLPVTVTVFDCVSPLPQHNDSGSTLNVGTGPLWRR